MIIACPKEIKTNEYRVGITPDNARDYIKNGHTVLIEQGAGLGSSFSDQEYLDAGAQLVSATQAWAQADMIVKVKEPLPEEYPHLREGQILYTYLHLAAEKDLTHALLERKVKAVAYETITDDRGGLPLLTPMSEVAGRLSVLEGAKHLQRMYGGRGVLLSGVPGTQKAKVVVLGGGVVGLSAAKMAMGLGANVSIVDMSMERLRYIDDLYGSAIQTIYSTESNVQNEIKTADLVIGAVLIPGAAAPKLVKRSDLKNMLPGAVIVDVAVDQGGCFETTKQTYHNDPIYSVDGIVHYCVANMPGATPRTSSIALTNATLKKGINIANNGLEVAAGKDRHILPGISTYLGHVTCKAVAEHYGMPYVDIHTLMSV